MLLSLKATPSSYLMSLSMTLALPIVHSFLYLMNFTVADGQRSSQHCHSFCNALQEVLSTRYSNVGQIYMKFSMRGHLTDIINRAKFYFNRIMGFDSVGVEFLAFP